jgi:regulator of sigma E protease
MGAVLGTILTFVLVFGILVFVHEFGHFFMAKLVGIRVEVFSWGYGKRIFGVKKGETDYRLSLIPLGGYVRFSGEDVLDQKRDLDSRDFMAKERWKRFLVMLMGSVMNIALAVFLVVIINIAGVSVSEHLNQKPVIGWIEPGSPAEKASLMVDDEILSINRKKVNTWSDVELAVGTKPKRVLSIDVKRGDEIQTVKLLTESKTKYEMGYAGFAGKIWAQIRMIRPHSPADKSGFLPGDVIREINGEPASYFQFHKIIQDNPEKELIFTVDREGESAVLVVTPQRSGEVGIVGITTMPKSYIKQYGFFSAIVQSFKENARLAFLVINFIKDLMTGEASARQLGGPIEIANFSYAAIRMGFMTLIWWMSFISLQLGIINLFPIPMLDGGQILVLGLEGLFRRDFSPRVKQVVMQIGFIILIALFAFVVLNDVVKRLPHGWDSLVPW